MEEEKAQNDSKDICKDKVQNSGMVPKIQEDEVISPTLDPEIIYWDEDNKFHSCHWYVL